MKAIFKVWIFITLILLAGCELNEEVVRRDNYAAKIKIREASLDKLLFESKFVTAYNKVYAAREKSRTVMESQYNFTIVPHGAKVIEDGTKTSYTFKITREINSLDYFENLVINVDSLGQSSAYIVKYTKSTPLSPSNIHESFYYNGEINISPIKYNIGSAGKTLHCVTATIMMCKEHSSGNAVGPVHVAGPNCNNNDYLYSVTTTTCDMTAGSGGFGGGYSGGDGMGGSGGGGDGQGPTDEDILTPPNNCPRCPDFTTAPVEEIDPNDPQSEVTPCAHLKNLIKTEPVKQSFATLESRKGQSGEWGFGFQTYDPTSSSIMAPNVIEASHTDPNKLNMKKAIGGNYIGASHTHPHISFDFFPMFSLDDIDYLLSVSRKHDTQGLPKDYSLYVLTLTTYKGVFAIKIKDALKFYTNFNLNRKLIEDQIALKYEKIKPGGNMNDFRLAFLDIIGQFDLGIGLYEATDNVTKWGELENKNGKPNLKPCD